ncbi:MerR family transcriptional regulator [Streptomyces sp. NPDC052179]|uniref:MerR family transcriptional regulator n=1 Tax=Streptomyces sp. NPDC052179 TaxID=3155680 RepID=UPI003447A9D9
MQTTMWLTTTEAVDHADRARQALTAGAARIRASTLRSWVTRGHLTATGLSEDGRPLYRLADVAKAEKATRSRALRLLGVKTSPCGVGPGEQDPAPWAPLTGA